MAKPDAGDEVTVVAPDVLVIPLWSPELCATVRRAAERNFSASVNRGAV